MLNNNNFRLAYSECGEGVPLVLLHGFPLNRRLWENQHVLEDHFWVITPDLRGHGESPMPAGDCTVGDMAQDLLRLLDRLKIDRAILMGHSMGGYVTLAAWEADPSRFSALGLICTQAGADADVARQKRLQLADRVAAEGPSVVESTMTLKMFAPAVSKDDANLNRVRQMILQTSVAGIQGALRAMASRPDRTSMLSSITVPTLVITGESDQLIPPARGESMATAIRGAHFVKIPRAGHLPMLEQPAATDLTIGAFLESINLDTMKSGR